MDSLLMPKTTAKFELDHGLRGDKCKWCGLKLAIFDKKRYNSQTVQDRRIVSIKVK